MCDYSDDEYLEEDEEGDEMDEEEDEVDEEEDEDDEEDSEVDEEEADEEEEEDSEVDEEEADEEEEEEEDDEEDSEVDEEEAVEEEEEEEDDEEDSEVDEEEADEEEEEDEDDEEDSEVDEEEADEEEEDEEEDSDDCQDAESIIEKKAEESTVKSGSRKRNRKSKETIRKSKKQKIESTSRVSQKIKKKLRKKKEFSDKNKRSSNKNQKKSLRPHVKISPGAIRKFSASHVRIPQSRMKWARKMVNTHIEFIRKYCKKHAELQEIFSHFEFTGSFYEHLKTEEANELDILVVLDTKNKADLVEEKVNDVPGYTLIKVTKRSSKYWQFVDDKQQGYVDPTKVRNWFFGQVQKAVNQYNKDKKDKDPELRLFGNGPATKLLIDDKKTDDKKNHGKLEVDLVPAFLFKPKKDRSSTAPVKGRRYVAKPPEEIKTDGFKYPREMLWRQSFSFEEKKKMEKMDAKDKGCRHEIVRVIKTIRNKDGTPLNLLSSYHVKTAFLHYNFDEGQENLEWSGKHLPERFLELMDYLRKRISEKRLSHFFINELNLLDEFSHPALNHIENRLSELISNEKKLKKVLMQGERSKMFRKVSAKR